ncbi:MAG: DUF1786 family protein [Actinomycetota bacterium]|nr:DUF1786 family protein [Actinomycetota bacterium]
MKILAMDIGAGTQDILLYDSDLKIENCAKLVLPSPSLREAAAVRKVTERGRDLFVTGPTIGGGAFSKALKKHLSAGLSVVMTPSAAFSVRNNPADVEALGIRIREKPPPGFEGVVLRVDELDLLSLRKLLASVGESLDGIFAAAVAVQDHGSYPAGELNRKTRLRHMRKRLEGNPNPLSLSYLCGDVPRDFPRMTSACARLDEQLCCGNLLVMDTAPAAISGCLSDPRVGEAAGGKIMLINAGNGHTMVALLDGGRVTALLEHHTRYLEARTFAAYLARFCAGEASDADPYMESGHGLFYLDTPPGMDELSVIAATGPNRDLMRETDLEVYYPAPGGDMMMTGPMGLVESLLFRLDEGGG